MAQTTTTRTPRVKAVSLLSIEDAAEILGVSVRYMRRLVAERRIRHVKIGHFVRFSVDDLTAFAASGVREVVPR